MTHIKVCGIKNEEHALAAAGAGAHFVGLVFATSRRRISPNLARQIVEALKENGAAVETVGVFVNLPAGEVDRIAETCGLDWVQLSGDETWEYCRGLSRPVIKAVRLSNAEPHEKAIENLAFGDQLLKGKKHLFLLDTDVPDSYGGTGKAFDWDLAVEIARDFPVLVAGGLTPQNVAGAVRTIRPWGVDVSSGVETGGVKDMKKIEKFIKAVRGADREENGE
jgi:phosphoribosylanthranilate isomerase